MDDLVVEFIAETREGLEALDSELVRFERHPTDPTLLSGIFRLIHTIKGTCGFLGLTRLQTVAHAAENVLGGFRDGELTVTPDSVSAILDTVDLIRSLLERLGVDGVEPAGDDSVLIARLEKVLVSDDGPMVVQPPTEAPADRRALIDQLGGDASVDAACEIALDTAGSGFGGGVFVHVDQDVLQAALRDALCATARGQIPAGEFANRLTICAGVELSEDCVIAVLEVIGDALLQLEVSVLAVDTLIKRARAVQTPPTPQQTAQTSSETPTLAPFAPQKPASVPEAAPSASRQDSELVQPAQTIRVSVDALEHLMTVASELVLIRNQLIQTLRNDPESAFAAPLNRLNQVTSELQEGVMTTRMQPISGAWAKLPRLVRDLANDLGKKIDLITSGQDTELDRQVLELIRDPLTHMIRNAADHGLETPADRLACGKPETGRLTLSARHEGGAIVIEVADDGRGLSAAKIRAKAVSSGVATQSQVEGMSDAEVRQFIFAAGFSTAAQVTAVSGRGVGMDVVRTNIEKIGGSIELSSVEGEGSRFTIRIPLTLTIVSALIVECCGERFAMPQSSVVELVSASDASGRNIEYIDGSAVLRLRDRLLPLVSLQTLLDLDADKATRGETCIVVAKVGAFTFGVIVDRVFDTEEIVVKPVASVLQHLKLYSGATILGDGSVILILDFKGIAVETGAGQSDSRAAEEQAAAAPPQADEQAAILIFRTAGGALKVVPLADVARIEEISLKQIENVDGRSVIQYRGQLMPIIGSDPDEIAGWNDAADRPLLVFTRDDSVMGLMVSEIVDVLNASIGVELPSISQGTLGSLIVGEDAAEMIDIRYYWRLATGGADAAATAAAMAEAPVPEAGLTAAPMALNQVPAASPAKRILVIDDSAFCQILLQPLLRQAGYDVTVARDANAALRLHDDGEAFNLILADIPDGEASRRELARNLGQATEWRNTPIVELGLHRPGLTGDAFNGGDMLNAVSENIAERGAA